MTKFTPSTYEPNPHDDRRLEGDDATYYRWLAVAIEELHNVAGATKLPEQVRRDALRAEAAARRSAYALVAYRAGHDPALPILLDKSS